MKVKGIKRKKGLPGNEEEEPSPPMRGMDRRAEQWGAE